MQEADKINGPFLVRLESTPAKYNARFERAIAKAGCGLNESGTFAKLAERRLARRVNTEFQRRNITQPRVLRAQYRRARGRSNRKSRRKSVLDFRRAQNS